MAALRAVQGGGQWQSSHSVISLCARAGMPGGQNVAAGSHPFFLLSLQPALTGNHSPLPQTITVSKSLPSWFPTPGKPLCAWIAHSVALTAQCWSRVSPDKQVVEWVSL